MQSLYDASGDESLAGAEFAAEKNNVPRFQNRGEFVGEIFGMPFIAAFKSDGGQVFSLRALPFVLLFLQTGP